MLSGVLFLLPERNSVETIIASFYRKGRDLGSLLVNRNMLLKNSVNMYCACLRPQLLYGAETWPTNKEFKIRRSNVYRC